MTRTFRTTLSTVAFALAAVPVVPVACGNYSNEDLEFMSAIPQREDLAVAVPAQASALSAGAADGWKTTLDVTTKLNQAADGFLALIENIRSYYPTARDANTRIWGPFAAENNPGWQVEFRMTKTLGLPQFTYEMVMIPPAGVSLSSGGAESRIIGGSFDAAGGVRIGKGHFQLTLVEARAAGAVFARSERLQTLRIDYDTGSWPRHLEMALTSDPPVNPLVDSASAKYTYERARNDDGAMTFTMDRDIVLGRTDTFQIASHWHGTGEGRQDLLVIAGPDVGATSVECWDSGFGSTYSSQSWGPTTGMADSCIPLL